jgi:hypothetical protein
MTPAHRMGNTKDASEKQLTVCLYVDFCPPGFRHMKRAVAAACFNAIRPQSLRPFRPSQADQESQSTLGGKADWSGGCAKCPACEWRKVGYEKFRLSTCARHKQQRNGEIPSDFCRFRDFGRDR